MAQTFDRTNGAAVTRWFRLPGYRIDYQLHGVAKFAFAPVYMHDPESKMLCIAVEEVTLPPGKEDVMFAFVPVSDDAVRGALIMTEEALHYMNALYNELMGGDWFLFEANGDERLLSVYSVRRSLGARNQDYSDLLTQHPRGPITFCIDMQGQPRLLTDAGLLLPPTPDAARPYFHVGAIFNSANLTSTEQDDPVVDPSTLS